jgi:hypothetical protein
LSTINQPIQLFHTLRSIPQINQNTCRETFLTIIRILLFASGAINSEDQTQQIEINSITRFLSSSLSDDKSCSHTRLQKLNPIITMFASGYS